jgi:hypothetical protein
MTHKVILSDEFTLWLRQQHQNLAERIATYLKLLASEGSKLGRPYADTLKGSSIKNLKELRIQYQGSPYRVLYVFDPKQQAFVILGGNKENDKQWYKKAISQAEVIYAKHLADLEGD